AIIFPPEYPYTSGSTRILRDNFADLYAESSRLLHLRADDLVIDIGSNDGTLLANFQRGGHRILGIEPTDIAKIAASRGIPTLQRYFSRSLARAVAQSHGSAKLVTAANCFAHIEDVHDIVDGICDLLAADGVFVSESHYLIDLIERLQYDTIYHEHLRYYSVGSLAYLFAMHGLEIFHVRRIPTHGGSIRVYAARKGTRKIDPRVQQVTAAEPRGDDLRRRLQRFRHDVVLSKLRLYSLLRDIKEQGGRICGISAPSRAATLVNYVGLDAAIIDYVCEIEGSLKIGKYMPGTLIPVVEEHRMFADQPACAVVFSWHIAAELAAKLRHKGYRGTLLAPLPDPHPL
ncbi:MAG: class I SAM-dependent methyltransferase, partial [Steroidobacteraceae bacterium]|nr:class I SAM-dependent methyltransferase [Steroidobacteraceae bacterium]